MKANEVVKSIMGEKGITQGELTKMINMKSQSGVSGALNRDMKTSTLVRFLDVMGCQLIIRDENTGNEYRIAE